jgi:hypothetical protein
MVQFKTQKNNKYAYTTIVIVLIAILASRIGTSVVDQDAYYRHFANWNIYDFWDKFFTPFMSGDYFVGVGNFIAEEIGWYLWVLLLNLFVEPSTAIQITRLFISVMVFMAIYRLNNRILLLILWIILPVALPVIGTYQIRQGFAFAIFMLCSSFTKTIFPGLFLGSLIHTTFAAPLLLALLIKGQQSIIKKYNSFFFKIKTHNSFLIFISKFALVGTSITTVVVTIKTFEYIFIGRRESAYDLESHSLSVNYLIFMILFGFLITLIWIRFEQKIIVVNGLFSEMFALTFICLPFFLAISFFFLPIATLRIGYYVILFSIPLLGTLSIDKSCKNRKSFNSLNLIILGLLLFVYIYLVSSSYKMGSYDCILGVRCDFDWYNPLE